MHVELHSVTLCFSLVSVLYFHLAYIQLASIVGWGLVEIYFDQLEASEMGQISGEFGLAQANVKRRGLRSLTFQ